MSFSSDGMPNGLELLGVERARDENTASNFRAATGKPIKKQIQENLEEEIVNEDFFNVQEDQPPRRVPMMVLKSNIQRDKVRHNRFKLPERSHEDLFREKVRTGPAMKSLYENDELIDVRGGDGTALIMSDFDGFVPQLTKNIAEKGIERPTLIQKCVMPIILTKSEFDLLARAETGTGKTAAFLFPIIHLLESDRLAIGTNPSTGKKSPFAPEAIIISPTRELAQQLGDTARTYCRGTSLRVVITYGEIPIPDTLADVAQGCDLLVTTIGRLMQFANERKLKLNKLRFLVLDEADKLIFDSIFFKSVLKIKDLMLTHHKMQREFDKNAVSLPPRTLMLSATYGDSESAVARVLRPGFFCVTVGTNDQLVFASTIKQKLIEIESRQMKIDVLFNLLTQLQSGIVSSSGGVTWRRLKTKLKFHVIFCNSRRITNWLAIKLSLSRYMAIPINGDRTQRQRHTALGAFEHGDCDILVSTNVAARGLNLADGFKLIVVNFELPRHVEDYVHRIGRTGRAGNIGRALSFVDLGSLAEVQFRNKLVESIVKLNKPPPQIIRTSL